MSYLNCFEWWICSLEEKESGELWNFAKTGFDVAQQKTNFQ